PRPPPLPCALAAGATRAAAASTRSRTRPYFITGTSEVRGVTRSGVDRAEQYVRPRIAARWIGAIPTVLIPLPRHRPSAIEPGDARGHGRSRWLPIPLT